MRRDPASDFIEESYWNEIWRLASVAPASGGGELGHGVSAAGQNIFDALGPGVPVTPVCGIFAGFDPASRRSCARYSEETTNRCRRVHPSILARLLLSKRLPVLPLLVHRCARSNDLRAACSRHWPAEST